ncbi:MAG: ABC-2 family transporter protein [archaeon]
MKVMGIKKDLSLFRVYLKNLSEYKMQLLSFILIIPVTIIVTYLIWEILLRLNITNLEVISKTDFLIYIVLATIVGEVIRQGRAFTIADDIMDGNLTSIITRPVSIIKYYIYTDIPITLLKLIIGGICFIFVIIFLKFQLLGIIYLFLFLISLFFGFLISIYFQLIIGFTSFWVYQNYGIHMLYFDALYPLLSGQMIPMVLLPDILQKIFFVLPFEHQVFTPVYILIGKFTIEKSLLSIGVQIIWVFLLYLFTTWMLKKGLKKFESQGG